MNRRNFLLSLSSLALCGPAWACIHGPSDFEGELYQEAQRAVIAFHEGQQDLFLAPTVRFKGQVPKEIAWVVPVPSVPSYYAEDKTGAMEALINSFPVERRAPVLSNGPEADSAEGLNSAPIELLAPKTAGDYTIQPIKTRGEGSAKALNEWLTQNGFGAVPTENMAYYIERQWVWLCVKAAPKGERSALKPLQISFATPEIVYPLKFSTHQGTFALELFVATAKPCSKLSKEAERFGLQHSSAKVQLPKSTQSSLKVAKLSGTVNLVRLRHPGLSGKTIVGWERDLALTP